jgi:hypothetical protein
MRTLAWMARNTRLLKGKSATETAPRRRVIVTERSADGVQAALEDSAFDETVLVAEAPADSGTDLLLRLAAHIASSERRSRAFSSASFVLGRGADAQTLAAREVVARTLLTHLETASGGELVLVAPAASAAERDDLLLLVERLLADLETRAVSIRLQFRNDQSRRLLPRELEVSPTSASVAS